jgi:site-specific DNA-methyltransferase (adenine-specific)
VELPKRCIKLFSYVGETVLDPFLGSGSTLMACLNLKRVGIGIEINREYCKLAAERVKAQRSTLKRTMRSSKVN